MAFLIENGSGAPLEIEDFGLTIATGATIDLAQRAYAQDIANSAAAGRELNTLILAGDIIVKDPEDGVTNLSASDGVSAAQVLNSPMSFTTQRVAAGSNVEVEIEDDGSSVTTAVKKLNFAGSGVTVTEPVADEVTLTITGGGGGGNATVQFNWRFSTATDATDPGARNFKYDNATLASVTNIYVNDTSNSNIDAGFILSRLTAGDNIYIQELSTAANNVLFNVTSAPTDNTGWWTIPVSVEDSGTIHGNNQDCGWILLFSAEDINGGNDIEVQDEGITLTTAVTQFNFVGGGVTATEPVADEITVTIPNDHTGLTNIGTNSHAAIDTHIADGTLHFTEGSIDHTAIQNIGTNSHAAIDSHIGDATIHFTEASIDHTAIQNIGTNSHAAIDSHIADGTLHFTEASIDHTNIQNVGTNSHAAIDSHIADATIHFTDGSIDRVQTVNADTGSFAAVGEDSFTITGGNGIDTTIVGDVLTIDGVLFDRQQASSSTQFTTTSTSLVDVTGMTLTTQNLGAAGTYEITYSCRLQIDQKSHPVTFSLSVGGSPVTSRLQDDYDKGSRWHSFSMSYLSTGLTNGTEIKIQVSSDEGDNVDIFDRQLIIDGVRDDRVL